ncbi:MULTISPECIES: helix-turn-helix domain-containing protein [unclassified Mesorhizobium]|uniref:helix-turn-helix domain-containing protein n=1 Tax=unclassified Mesorhizobium TaxID=325217 RepID=UPI000FDC991E|nr:MULTISPECIES: helix-turn-helix domain-containing protein [unclassified Mesorhizobium]TGQ16363.1 hypothetical protein EN862_002370 [Mesorhizobium sp. M2E.F.Ca.ET.219.01.1.1]TGT77540.1 hypothetical protein EN809_008190 [Mesorhizobium sp. M2E.F.Ca.ET.166.01.1.1]TGW03649.1 hypothetical protein EN797_008190 [Mesorhizobium sp. M2E.F.Ca.ET.154.01.1.1]
MKSFRHSGVVAAREHLLSGEPMTRLEAIILFGVPDLTKLISDLRHEGFIIHTRQVSYVAAVSRVNRHAVLHPPANLPVKEITLTDYWVSR